MSEKEKKDLEVSAEETVSEEVKSEPKAEKKAEKKSGGAIKASRKWFRELKSEFKKIVWPTGKQLWKNTVVVMSVLIFVGIVIALVDAIFQYGILNGLLRLVSGY